MLLRVPTLLTLLALGSAAAGCGTVNEKLASGAGDLIPQWAGGLPPNAPPRPGTPEYDAWMREMERRRAMPAAERQELERTAPSAADAVR